MGEETVNGNDLIISGLFAGIVILALILILIVLFVLLLVTRSQIKKMQKKHDSLMNGLGVANLEEVIIQLQNHGSQQATKLVEQGNEIKTILTAMKSMKSKLSVIRYSAFSQQGSDLSFSVALIDQQQNGVVLSGIHSREDHIMYAKPLQNGESPYPLTPEEKMAIQQAIKSE